MTEATAGLAALARRAAAVGLAVRGACHEDPGTIVLLGFTGSDQWPVFAASPEAHDGRPHPLDRWSRRLIDALAVEYGATASYPNDVPALPFQRLAQRCEALHPSPLGLLIHPGWGLWHAWRGALLFAQRLPLAPLAPQPSPCERCAGRPCVPACPVDAFGSGTLDVAACVHHVTGAAGADCREFGCRARRACPVGTPHAYVPDQARFHLAAFVRATVNRA
jgi:hypothetical protein